MPILKNDLGLIQLHRCPKCNYLVQWNDTLNDEHLCKWCAVQKSIPPTRELAIGIVAKVCETMNIDPSPKMIEQLVTVVEKTIDDAKQKMQPTDGGLCENCGEPLAAAALHEHCFPPATISG